MKYIFELCAGRHQTPADKAIFAAVNNVTDTEGLLQVARENIPADCSELTVYVTGLTPAMLAVVRACAERGIALVAMHFDRESGTYYPQKVL